ncbi:hypothetical protein BJF84_19425 [Rhodococcus sp. CUA-806]|nr:hypothetical protein BJF84_19425 [Rhodococcus sp. CUA-806]
MVSIGRGLNGPAEAAARGIRIGGDCIAGTRDIGRPGGISVIRPTVDSSPVLNSTDMMFLPRTR